MFGKDNGASSKIEVGESADAKYATLAQEGYRPAIQIWLRPAETGFDVCLTSEVSEETTVRLLTDGIKQLATDPSNN